MFVEKEAICGASKGIFWFLFGFSSINMKPNTTHAVRVSQESHQFIIIWNDLKMRNQIMAERSMSFFVEQI